MAGSRACRNGARRARCRCRRRGRPGRRTHDYVRNGPTILFAAFDTARARSSVSRTAVTGVLRDRSRWSWGDGRPQDVGCHHHPGGRRMRCLAIRGGRGSRGSRLRLSTAALSQAGVPAQLAGEAVPPPTRWGRGRSRHATACRLLPLPQCAVSGPRHAPCRYSPPERRGSPCRLLAVPSP